MFVQILPTRAMKWMENTKENTHIDIGAYALVSGNPRTPIHRE